MPASSLESAGLQGSDVLIPLVEVGMELERPVTNLSPRLVSIGRTGSLRPTTWGSVRGRVSLNLGRLRGEVWEEGLGNKDRNDWLEDQESMELAFMMGMHTRLGDVSDLIRLSEEGPGLHLMMLYGPHALLLLRAGQADSSEYPAFTSDGLALESAPGAGETSGIVSKGLTKGGSHIKHSVVHGALKYRRATTDSDVLREVRGYWGGSFTSTVERIVQSEESRPRRSLEARVWGAELPPGEEGIQATEADVFVVEKMYFVEVGAKWLVRRGRSIAERAARFLSVRGRADQGLIDWRIAVMTTIIRKMYKEDGPLELCDLTKCALRDILREATRIEGNKRLFPEPEQAITHSKLLDQWGGEFCDLSDADLMKMVAQEKQVLKLCIDGLAEEEANGVSTLADHWAREDERLHKGKQREQQKVWTLGSPAVVQPALTSQVPGLYTIYGDALAQSGYAKNATSAFKFQHPRDSASIQAQGLVKEAFLKANKDVRELRSRLELKSSHVRYLKGQHSHAAFLLGKLDETETDLDITRADIKQKEAQVERLRSMSLLQTSPIVETAQLQKLDIISLNEEVQGLHATVAGLNCEAAEIALELLRDHGMSVHGSGETGFTNAEWGQHDVRCPSSANRKMQRLDQVRIEVLSKENLILRLQERLKRSGISSSLS